MKKQEEHWLTKERFVLFLLFLLVTAGYRMEYATRFYAPACFLVGLLRCVGGISVLGFKYFTFLCGLVVQYDEVLLSCASALVTRLLTCWISSFQMPFGTRTSFFTENKNSRLVLLHSLTFCSAKKILFSCFSRYIPYWLCYRMPINSED